MFCLNQDRLKWSRKCLINIASSGRFSSDRSIIEYAEDIWGVEPTWETKPAPCEVRPETENEQFENVNIKPIQKNESNQSDNFYIN